MSQRTDNSTQDYAIVKLDRQVVGATPLKVRKRQGTIWREAFLIGHPMGIPAKVTNKAKVKSFVKFNSPSAPFGLEKHPLFKKRKTFFGDFDSYSGNSGSPVFNAKTGVVEGILIEEKMTSLLI